jgi:hypothetical protein
MEDGDSGGKFGPKFIGKATGSIRTIVVYNQHE